MRWYGPAFPTRAQSTSRGWAHKRDILLYPAVFDPEVPLPSRGEDLGAIGRLVWRSRFLDGPRGHEAHACTKSGARSIYRGHCALSLTAAVSRQTQLLAGPGEVYGTPS